MVLASTRSATARCAACVPYALTMLHLPKVLRVIEALQDCSGAASTSSKAVARQPCTPMCRRVQPQTRTLRLGVLLQLAHHVSRLLLHHGLLAAPDLRDALQHCREARSSKSVLGREVGAPHERLQVCVPDPSHICARAASSQLQHRKMLSPGRRSTTTSWARSRTWRQEDRHGPAATPAGCLHVCHLPQETGRSSCPAFPPLHTQCSCISLLARPE
jgi:hypothetical protein